MIRASGNFPVLLEKMCEVSGSNPGQALVFLLLLVVLWPTDVNGRRLLKKWGVAEPSDEQVAEGVRYLKRRRLLYPWLYAVLWLVPKWGDDVDQLVVVVIRLSPESRHRAPR